MKRNLSLTLRFTIAVCVFVLTVLGLCATTGYAVFVLADKGADALAMVVLLLTWSTLAYFLARLAFRAVTYRTSVEGLHCEGCGYNLMGNESGICPECGRMIEAVEIIRQMQHATESMHEGSSKQKCGVARWIPVGIKCCAVCVFVVALLVWADYRGRDVLPGDFALTRNPFRFVEWAPSSEMVEVEPNTVFALANNKVQANFTFHSANRRIVDSVVINDAAQRPWFSINLRTNRYQINQYPTEDPGSGADPLVTLIDDNGDGFLDHKKDWASGTVLCLQVPITWTPCESTIDQRD